VASSTCAAKFADVFGRQTDELAGVLQYSLFKDISAHMHLLMLISIDGALI